MASLIGSLVALVRSWWQVDRVRVSPREGRLLRLGPSWFIRVAGCTAAIERRYVGETDDGPYVGYVCRGTTGPCELRVGPPLQSPQPRVVWTSNGRSQVLDADEVEVVAPW
jgi:hypothetical protein